MFCTAHIATYAVLEGVLTICYGFFSSERKLKCISSFFHFTINHIERERQNAASTLVGGGRIKKRLVLKYSKYGRWTGTRCTYSTDDPSERIETVVLRAKLAEAEMMRSYFERANFLKLVGRPNRRKRKSRQDNKTTPKNDCKLPNSALSLQVGPLAVIPRTVFRLGFGEDNFSTFTPVQRNDGR